MKKGTRKVIFNVIIAIVTLGMVVTIFAGIKFPKSGKTDKEVVVAEVAKAPVGAVAKVTLTDIGKEQYKDAVKFQIYDGDRYISAVTPFNEKITIFPAKKDGDKVTIKLFSNKNQELDKVQVNLKKLKK